MSQRTAHAVPTVDSLLNDAVAPALNDPLAEGNSYTTVNPDHPLQRDVVVSIKATLNELCLKNSRAKWAPTPEALRSIFQQRKFTSLDGSVEPCGDLKSVVLHNMDIKHCKSTFPMTLGAHISCVDKNTYTSTGAGYSTVVLPNSESSTVRKLQADDVSLAYEFAKKFPGYTSDNLAEKGVHEVSQRRFVLVAADHPIVSAISENADKLQMGEISMMPEGLVKISSQLYESILPLVRTQVESQIKVRDLSHASVSVAPAEFASWNEARSELMVEGKKPLMAQRASEIAAAPESEHDAIRAEYAQRERALEHEIDHRPLEVHMSLGVGYNFLS